MILVFPSSTFVTDRSKAVYVLLYFCSSLTYILVCVFQPCGHLLGKWLRPSSPVRQAQSCWSRFFWLSMFSVVSFFLLLAYFSLSVAHVINRHCQDVKTSSHRNIGYGSRHEKPKVVAFQQQGRSLISDFVVQSLESIIDKLAIHTKFKHSS